MTQYFKASEAKSAFERGESFVCTLTYPPTEFRASWKCPHKCATPDPYVIIRPMSDGNNYTAHCARCDGPLGGITKWRLGWAETPTRQSHKSRWHVLTSGGQRSPHCAICGAIPEQAHLEVDHILPFKKWNHQDADTVYNLTVLCRQCNGKGGKGDKYLPSLAKELLTKAAIREGLSEDEAKWKADHLIATFEAAQNIHG